MSDELTLPNTLSDVPAWHGGRPWAAVWAVLLDLGVTGPVVDAARARLDGWLLPRWERQPHVTIDFAGLVAHGDLAGYDRASVERDVKALRSVLEGPVTLRSGAWSSFPMVPHLDIECEWLERAHAVLPAPPADSPMRYRPHLTIGQYAVRRPMVEAVALLGDAPRLQWQVDQAQLVRYATDDISGPLSLEGTLDLTSGAWRWADDSVLARRV